MRSRLLTLFGILISILLVAGLVHSLKSRDAQTTVSAGPKLDEPNSIDSSIPSSSPSSHLQSPLAEPSAHGTPSLVPTTQPGSSLHPTPSPSSTPALADLSVDPHGLSRTTAVIHTNKGIIRFKFYPQDAPKTVHRIIELIQKGFYNGLTFHRVIPGFIIQGGDPLGTSSGGSGQKLEPEFNSRRHVEGTLGMARAADDSKSADSQFYITLGAFPALDRNYTVFGQVTEGMNVAKQIRLGDKIITIEME